MITPDNVSQKDMLIVIFWIQATYVKLVSALALHYLCILETEYIICLE